MIDNFIHVEWYEDVIIQYDDSKMKYRESRICKTHHEIILTVKVINYDQDNYKKHRDTKDMTTNLIWKYM